MSATRNVPEKFQTWGESTDDGPVAVAAADQIAYVADMIMELQTMVRRSNLTTLAGILDLAHAEALLQAQRANPRSA
jgi:hypothetical protein